ncbi:MAG: lysophospholipid acyltransferase family protein [Planctomycetota bacterium]
MSAIASALRRPLWPGGPGYFVLRAISQWIAATGLGLSIEGGERVPAGGFVLASNHQSFLDPWLLGAACPRPVRFLARRSLFRNPVFGLLIRSLGAIPLGSDGDDQPGSAGIRGAVEAIREGCGMVIFPEGSRGVRGVLREFRRGALFLARQADVPVVPVCVDGCWRAWPPGRLLPRPSPVRISFGEPVRLEALGDDPAGAVRARVEDLLAT